MSSRNPTTQSPTTVARSTREAFPDAPLPLRRRRACLERTVRVNLYRHALGVCAINVLVSARPRHGTVITPSGKLTVYNAVPSQLPLTGFSHAPCAAICASPSSIVWVQFHSVLLSVQNCAATQVVAIRISSLAQSGVIA